MRRLKTIFYVFMFFFRLGYGQNIENSNENFLSVSEQDYYYALTEATKYYLFGNYSQSLNLYKKCLEQKPESPSIHYQLAKILFQSGNLDLAKYHAKLACELSSEGHWYLQLLGSIYQADKSLDSANIIYLKLLVQDKDNYDLRYKLALNYEYLGNLNLSLVYLKSIEDKYGESKDLILEKSRILTKNKDYDSALKELLKVLAIDNEDVTVLGLMAELYREIGKIDSAWVYYKRIYPKYASDPFVTISFAEFLLNIGSYDKGKEILISLIYNDTINSDVRDGLFFSLYNEEKRYILYKPLLDTLLSAYHEVSNNNLRSLSIISDLYFKTEKYFKASTLLKEIIDLDKNNYAAYEQIIYCFNSLHFTDSVLKYAGVSLVQFPLRPLAYLYYGSACFEKKDYVNGCNILEKGLKYSDNESLLLDFYNLLGEGYNKLNNFTKSDEYFEKALRNSDNSIIRNNYAYYLSIRKEKLDIALEMSKYTLMRDAKNPIFLDTYGWIFYQLGNLQKAKSYIKKALKNGGNRNGEIWLHYGDVLHDLNKNFGAEKAWEISLMYIGEDKKNEVRTRLNTLK